MGLRKIRVASTTKHGTHDQQTNDPNAALCVSLSTPLHANRVSDVHQSSTDRSNANSFPDAMLSIDRSTNAHQLSETSRTKTLLNIVTSKVDAEYHRIRNIKMHPLTLKFNDSEIENEYFDKVRSHRHKSLQHSLFIFAVTAFLYTPFNLLEGNHFNASAAAVVGINLTILLVWMKTSHYLSTQNGFLIVWSLTYIHTSLAMSLAFLLDRNTSASEEYFCVAYVMHFLVRCRFSSSLLPSIFLVVVDLIARSTYMSWTEWGRVAFLINNQFLANLVASRDIERLERFSFLKTKEVEAIQKMCLNDHTSTWRILRNVFPRVIADSIKAGRLTATDILESEKCYLVIISPAFGDFENGDAVLVKGAYHILKRIVCQTLPRYGIDVIRNTGFAIVGAHGLFKSGPEGLDDVLKFLQDTMKAVEDNRFCNDFKLEEMAKVLVCEGSCYSGFLSSDYGLHHVFGKGLESLLEGWMSIKKAGVFVEMTILGKHPKAFPENSDDEHRNRGFMKIDRKYIDEKVRFASLIKSGRIEMINAEQINQELVHGKNLLNQDEIDAEYAELHKKSLARSRIRRGFSIRLHMYIFFVAIAIHGGIEFAGILGLEIPPNPLTIRLYMLLRYGVSLVICFLICVSIHFGVYERVNESGRPFWIIENLPNICMVILCMSSLVFPALLQESLVQNDDVNLSSFVLFEPFAVITITSATPTIRHQAFRVISCIWVLCISTIYYFYAEHVRVPTLAGYLFLVSIKYVLISVLIVIGVKNKDQTIRTAAQTRTKLELESVQYAKQRKRMETIILGVIPRVIYEAMETGNIAQVANVSTGCVILVHISDLERHLAHCAPRQRLSWIRDFMDHLQHLGSFYGLEMVKNIGHLYMFASTGEIKGVENSEKCAFFAIKVAQSIQRWTLPSALCVDDFRISVEHGRLIRGFTDEPLVSFDVWGETVETCFVNIRKSSSKSIVVGAKYKRILSETRTNSFLLEDEPDCCTLDWKLDDWMFYVRQEIGDVNS